MKTISNFKKVSESNNWHLVAISMGGMIAIEWSKLFPKDFKSMVILNTSASGICLPFERLRPWGLLQLIKVGVTNNDNKKE